MHITIIAGARPNFIKISPIINEIRRRQSEGADIQYSLVHTGQHYDKVMSGLFFEELNIPEPDVNLAAGGGSQAEQTASIMVAFEKYLAQQPTDLVMVVGDVTSTMACAIVAKKMCIPLAHVEAGIRSFDMTMPEEVNRIVTDSLTDYYFITSAYAKENLKKCGVSDEKVFFVGNVMIDSLLANLPRLRKPAEFDQLNLKERKYIVLTLHRPNNVDDTDSLLTMLRTIDSNVGSTPVVFPIHPRTKQKLDGINCSFSNIRFVSPMGYLEFIYLVKHSLAVITDSGGITEETTILRVPCLTLRDNTERPETCAIGTNELIGTNPQNLIPALKKLFSGQWKKGGTPELWDGRTAERIVNIIIGK
jgi:UDP-N-acetylglucosamine 2-epimerase (non-hydrolysing)